MSRQSTPTADVSGAVLRQRSFFTKAINDRMESRGIGEKDRTTWLREKLLDLGDEVRWQTVQAWILGRTFPSPRRVRLVAKALDMNFLELMMPLTEEPDDPPAWRSFVATPEGASASEEERWAMRFFPWPNKPTVGNYRQLLALIRTNAEQGE